LTNYETIEKDIGWADMGGMGGMDHSSMAGMEGMSAWTTPQKGNGGHATIRALARL